MQVDFGGPTTFGLEVAVVDDEFDREREQIGPDCSTFKLGDMIERGCFNHRWPFNEYYLDLHEKLGSDGKKTYDGRHVGTCQMFSFAYPKEKTFYQILRVEEGSVGDKDSKARDPKSKGSKSKGSKSDDSKSTCKFPYESQIVLTIGGPVWFRSFDAADRSQANG
jgi:hypothetical protein